MYCRVQENRRFGTFSSVIRIFFFFFSFYLRGLIKFALSMGNYSDVRNKENPENPLNVMKGFSENDIHSDDLCAKAGIPLFNYSAVH